jgi:RNA polymerase sigma factor (sigma-70 family)
MTAANLSDFLSRLTRGMSAGALAEQSDRQLVEQFLAAPGEAAFEAIVRRHGPMVYRVCWRVLRHEHDVEDAFQATFLVLARQCHTIRNRDALASWLHGVAHRVALRAKAAAATRDRHERQAGVPDGTPPEDMSWREARALLDAELAELPEKWRLPLILCYLEGRTQDEAAAQTGWSRRTLRRRLEEARVALGHRLARRGVVWPAALAGVLLSDSVLSAALRPGLVGSTVAAGTALGAGMPAGGLISANVAALMEGAWKATSVSTLRVATVVLVLAAVAGGGLIAGGTALLGGRGTAGQPAPAGKGAANARADGEIGRLVRRLGSGDVDEREAAAGHLEAIGRPALGALRQAAKGDDPDVRRRARHLVQAIEGGPFAELRRLGGHAPHWVIGVAIAPDGRAALSGGFDGTVRLWDLEEGEEVRRFEGHEGGVLAVAFSPDGRRALSGGQDRTLRVWDVASGTQLRRLEGHASQVRCVRFLADGRRALSSSKDTTIRLWDVDAGKELRRFEGHTAEPMTVAVSPDEKRILSASFDGTMRLWDTQTGEELKCFDWKGGRVYAAAFSPDGRRALSGSDDRTVRLWDLEKGAELRRFVGHTDGVFGVAFSRDGRRALSGSQDATVRLWDVDTGDQIGRFEGHTAGVFSVAFARDGRRALSGGKDGTVRYWRLPP